MAMIMMKKSEGTGGAGGHGLLSKCLAQTPSPANTSSPGQSPFVLSLH